MSSKNRAYSLWLVLLGLFVPASLLAQTLTVTYPSNYNVSPKLTELHGSPMVSGPLVIRRPLSPGIDHGRPSADAALQSSPGAPITVSPIGGFEGMNVGDGGYIPSDNNIAVGPNHVVEVVNAAVSVYSKSGARLWGPIPMKNIWTSLTGSACAANNGGDVIAQYDRLADRWLLTQLGSLSQPYSQCIAVSKTNDPAGAYSLYSYGFGSYLNDYPKFGVWPTATNSAYLATYNLFYNGSSFSTAQICAYDRAAMLAGSSNPASVCYSQLTGASFLPSDLDGGTPPPNGTPAYFVNLYGSSLGVYALNPNFVTPSSSTLTRSAVTVAGYTQASSSPQPNTTRTLDALSDRLMYRLAYRVISDRQSMLVNHSVQSANTSLNSGVRWYELRSPLGGSFSLYQQGTFAPDDGKYRWMGSLAMDKDSNIALGYSVSSNSLYPSVAFTGQASGSTLNTMADEVVMKLGGGSQTGYSRWGDYSSMRIDPSDDCTFWYVNEFLPTTSSAGWSTWIGNFKLNNCGGPSFSLVSSPSSLAVRQGASTPTSTITLTPSNSYGDITNLAISSGCPLNASCSLSSPTLPPNGTTTFAVSTTSLSTTNVGTYQVAVTGTAQHGPQSYTLIVPIKIWQVVLGGLPANVTVKQGSFVNVSVTPAINPTGAVGPFSVTLSVSGLPSNVSSNGPITVSTGNKATFKISTNRSANLGTYALTVTSSDGGGTVTGIINLTVR